MKKLISLIVAIYMIQYLPILLNSCEDRVESAVKELDEGGITYLLCGFDNAAENTDSMILVNYSFLSNEIHFIQIPRDTYFEYKGCTKVNSIYPLLRSSGKTPHEAMETLRATLSEALGIEIDAYVGYSIDAIANLVDDIGGVALDVYEEEDEVFYEDFSNEIIQDDVLSRLCTLPNVLITSHMGFFTKEAMHAIATTTLQNAKDFENGEKLVNVVR